MTRAEDAAPPSVAASGGQALPPGHDSLALGVPSSVPGTVFALALSGGMALGPGHGRRVLFGRNRPEVHVCLGEDDQQVSRCQGMLTHDGRQWSVRNTGKPPIRLLGNRLLFAKEEPIPLATGYTPLYVRGSGNREHLLEVFVSGPDDVRRSPRPGDVTRNPHVWQLSEDEKLAVIVLGQRYLLHDPRPQPLTWKETAAQLNEVQPGRWSEKSVARVINEVRLRLSRAGVPYLTREEVGEPVGNSLNDNLMWELLLSTTLSPADMELIEPPSPNG